MTCNKTCAGSSPPPPMALQQSLDDRRGELNSTACLLLDTAGS